MARRVTYTVHDGEADQTPQPEPVPKVTPESQVKNGIVATVILSILSAVIGIATSRWGGVSQATYDLGRTNDKEARDKWQGEMTSKVNSIDGKVDQVINTVGGITVILEQQAKKKGKGK